MKLEEIKPEDENEMPVFKDWLENTANTLIQQVIGIMSDICTQLRETAVEIIHKIWDAAGLITDFFSKRASKIMGFFENLVYDEEEEDGLFS